MNRIQPGSVPAFDLTGCLITAAPGWDDAVFCQSVCLIVHHGANGAIGIFLNRIASLDARAFWQQVVAPGETLCNSAIYLGGPNAGPVVAMHQRQDLAEFVSADDVFFAAKVDSLRQLVGDQNQPFRVFVGQATWQAGELERQFAAGHWLPIPVQSRVVFEAADSMWRVALREAGNRIVEGMLGQVLLPPDIELN